MIKKVVEFFVNDLAKHNNYDEVQKEQMNYVLRVLLYEIIKIIVVLLISLTLGYFKECALILIFMVSTKPFTGGYHEDTQLRCFIATLAIVFFIIILSKNSDLSIVSCIILNLVSIFSIYNQVPIINKKMPLTKNKLIKRNRIIGITINILFLLLSLVLFNIRWVSQIIVWTGVVQTMLLFNKYKRVKED